MKITNWRRKLAATLVAGGMLSPAAAQAANLNTNLVLNGDFEAVDLGTPGVYNGVKLQNWDAGSRAGFAYGYSLNYDYRATPTTKPPSPGSYFFTPNQSGGDGTDVTDAGVISQFVDVSAGATGSAIAAGKGRVDLSAYFTSYFRPSDNDSDGDIGNVQVDFLDAGDVTISSAVVSNRDYFDPWKQFSKSAPVPIGTAKFKVSLYGTPTQSGPDGYTDNVDVRMSQTAAEQFLVLEVNTLTGQAAIKNPTGAAVNIDYYEIVSGGGTSLDSVAWNSLQEQNLAGFPPGNGSGNGWESAGGSGAGVVSESYLTGMSSVSTANVPLGGLFKTGFPQDLTFRYGEVTIPPKSSDFDFDGDVDGADLLVWQKNFEKLFYGTQSKGDATGDHVVNAADLAEWKAAFGIGPSGPGSLVRGLVRYVTTGPVAAVPEPTSVLLVGLGVGMLAVRRRRD
jgi:hypothetical protein